jgi:prepilin-type N-terminal cleavage/methylation domain-containing protein
MNKRQKNAVHGGVSNLQRGFSLIELMLTVAILLMVMAGVFGEIGKLQKVSRDEDLKREMFQNAREFMDQMGRDLHGSGSPNKRQFSPPPTDNQDRIAVGLVSLSSQEIIFEGDVHGDGLVSSVAYKYTTAVPAGSNATCPCLLRAEIAKLNNTAPTAQATTANYYVALENVVAPTAGTPIFSFYDNTGAAVTWAGWNTSPTPTAIDISASPGATTIAGIRTVRVFINVQAATPDLDLARRTAASLTQEVRLNNY